MELGQILEQRQTVTPQLVLANTLLQLSATELERAIAQELAENPVLELVEVASCPHCGSAFSDGRCPACGRPDVFSAPADLYSTPASEADFDGEVISQAVNATLSEHLLRQARLVLAAEDWPIATFLVESLDERGLLCADLDEVAALFAVERARVDAVVAALQGLEPVGIAARDVRECLLIQLEHLRREGIDEPLAWTLIADHWDSLGGQPAARLARTLGTTVDRVQHALQFIRENLNPYPAQADWSDPHESPPPRAAPYPRPDVIISANAASGGYEVELPGAYTYRLRISDAYFAAIEHRAAVAGEDWQRWQAFYNRARLFVKSVEQRWQTLRQLALYLVDYQRDFLAHGDGHLKPLTRAQLAEAVGVHESTISRAVAGKYVQLPCGRIVPLARFFDRAAPLKAAIRDIVTQEATPLSDREIAARLAQRGYAVARRTVTKYRSALHIPPSWLR